MDLHVIGMARGFLLFSLCLLLASCGAPRESQKFVYEQCHYDEFVEDSKIVEQGKLAIMELEGKSVLPFSPEMMEEYTDTVEENDVLRVRLFHPQVADIAIALQEMDKMGFRVIDGFVALPGLSPVRVEGLTLRQVRERLRSLYDEQIEGVEVFVDYLDRLTRKVELVGMVSMPSIPVDGKKRLYEVLSEAKLSPQANLFGSFVVRDGMILPIDFNRLLRQGDLSRNIVMYPKDKVYVANTDEAYVMVMGEVFQPKAVSVPYGSISLRDALVSVGGVPYTGNRESILVIRGGIEIPKLYMLRWDEIIRTPNKSLLLMPGDTVFVAEKPITKWNRFINQLFPSFSGLLTIGQIKKVAEDR